MSLDTCCWLPLPAHLHPCAFSGWESALEEDVETHNPFFSLYNADRARYAFHNQIMFLTKSGELHQRMASMSAQAQYYVDDRNSNITYSRFWANYANSNFYNDSLCAVG